MREDKEIEWEAADQWMSADGSGGDEIDSIPKTSSYYVYGIVHCLIFRKMPVGVRSALD